MLDYEILRIIWWVLLGTLLAGFVIFDGFDIGAAILLPWIAKKDLDRRIVINTVGPVWEGNQVWFILGGGAIFAAWPALYGASFSGFYLAMCLVLATFIIRPVAFKFRSKHSAPQWRQAWDIALASSGTAAAILFGVAIGNVLQGVPFHFDADLRAFYTGSFWQLLNPFALVCGVLSLAMFSMHGGYYLATKTQRNLQNNAKSMAQIASFVVFSLFALAGLWVVFKLPGFQLDHPIAHNAPSNPLHKAVHLHVGAWAHNFHQHPWMLAGPLLGLLGSVVAMIVAQFKLLRTAFVASALSCFGLVTTVGLSMFPFILPSSSDPQSSLLVWDASSSQRTLTIMLFATAIFLPIILAYTRWVYHVLRGPVTKKVIEQNDQSY